MKLNCCWPLAIASNVTAELTRAPSGPAADALTEVPRPETSATVTFVRKLLPWNAPENVSGKRGPAAENTSMPFIVKPYVPLGPVLYVRLVTFTPSPVIGVMKSAPLSFVRANSVFTRSGISRISRGVSVNRVTSLQKGAGGAPRKQEPSEAPLGRNRSSTCTDASLGL